MYVFGAVDGVLAIGHGGGSLGVKDMHLHADDIHFAAAAEHVGGLMDVGHDTSMVVDAGLGPAVTVDVGVDLVLYTVVPQRPIGVAHHEAHIVGCMVRNGVLCVEGCWKNT